MFVLTGSCMPRSYFNICEFCDLYNFKHCKLLKGGAGGREEEKETKEELYF